MASGGVGIAGIACSFPAATRTTSETFAAEGLQLSTDVDERLDIATISVSEGESGADLALEAATRSLDAAGVSAEAIDVILDYTVLPQHYLVPAWNLGNKLQHELGAVNAFTLGFSGGGATNFHVALRFATDLITANEDLGTVLLFGADLAIPGNRVITGTEPVTVLGDGASAIVLSAESDHNVVLSTELISDGAYHDVCYIPGGALAHLAEPDTDHYRLRVDAAKLAAAPISATLERLGQRAADGADCDVGEVAHHIFPNLSAADQAQCRNVWGAAASPPTDANRQQRGHVQATDLAINLESVIADDGCRDGDLILIGSHGMGFTAGVSLLRH